MLLRGALLAADLLLGQPGVLAVADLGRQAVDGLAVGQGPVHDSPAGRDPGPGPAVQLHPCAADHGQQVLDRQRASVIVTVVMGLLQGRRGCPLPRT
jgi:hypothetical protein